MFVSKIPFKYNIKGLKCKITIFYYKGPYIIISRTSHSAYSIVQLPGSDWGRDKHTVSNYAIVVCVKSVLLKNTKSRII